MKYIILFTDNPDADPNIRTSLMPDHLAFLEAHAKHVSAAGPLHDASGVGAGGLWIVDADDEQQVEALVHQDPFWPTGLRQSFSVRRWTQVFADGKRNI